ncbi:hypothetical protein K458DRAFT_429301 [Lentithecium fluviatile CBS 122367]|uniref:Uncharacterized protein n=1 Tax=Lentithecium fluviatile CBS 122367 TaxID=1168545 RepID=A0A6G1JB23_9PLEO|nr:hypothetical protein K458DRAFT_429301 [Lentithecium fluviatile CBS 122367]
MDEPARKRRKTSSSEGDGRPSSPLKQPPRRPSFASHARAGAERQSSPLKEPPRRPSMSPTKGAFDRSSPLKQRPRRPSFASPTKASLSRNYPGLLPERPSSGLATSSASERANLLARGKEARAFVLGDKDTQSQSRPAVTGNGEESQTSAGALQARMSEPQNVTPRARRTTRQGALGNVSEEEADLPTPPSQRIAEEQDTPRRGILYSSPSKRPRPRKDPAKASSLKSGAPPVQQERSEIPLDEPLDDEVEAPTAEKKQKQPPDPELEKRKQERKRLLREVKELESQVSRCTDEIVKMQEQSATHVLEPAEREDLIAFINKISKPDAEADEDQPPAVSSLLCSFLPFSTKVIPPPKWKQTQQKPVASHRPLDLDDPLPYLGMFTDFKMSTQPNLPRGRVFPGSNRVHQKHVIDLVGPQKLLTTSISIIIDTLTNTIIDLKVLRLPPWADRELGTFMRVRAQEKDLGNVCWAVGSYWNITRKRAEFWYQCETSFAHLFLEKSTEDTENQVQVTKGKAVTRKDLNHHLGRDVLVLQDQHVVLKIRWGIMFDWTGEAESEISVEPAVPQVWSEADSNNSFKKIPETFTSLLQSKGVFAATKTMVTLLFAES